MTLEETQTPDAPGTSPAGELGPVDEVRLSSPDASDAPQSKAGALALLGLVLLVVLSQALWLSWDRHMPDCDTPTHFGKAYQHLQIWLQPHPWLERVREALIYKSVFPPLMYALASVACYVRGAWSIKACLALHLALWPLLLLYTWLLGSLVGGRRQGLWAAIATASAPCLILLSHKLYPEFTQTALVVPACYHLLASRDFEDRVHSWCFGGFLGLAMLVKWTSVVYVGGALLWSMGKAGLRLVRGKGLVGWGIFLVTCMQLAIYYLQEKSLYRPVGFELPFEQIQAHAFSGAVLLLCFALGLQLYFEEPALVPWLQGLQALSLVWGLAGAWYLRHMALLVGYVPHVSYKAGVVEGDPAVRSLASLLYYPWTVRYGQHPLVTLCLVAGLVHVLRGSHPRIRQASLLWLCVLLSYGAFTAVVNKEARYFWPLLPVMACLMHVPETAGTRWKLYGGRFVTVALGLLFGLQLLGWCLPLPPLGVLGLERLTFDEFSASAMVVPGTHVQAHITPSTLLWMHHMPLLGQPPRQDDYDDSRIYPDTGP